MYNNNIKQKKLADCYFYHKGKNGRIIEGKTHKLNGILGIGHKKMIECDDPTYIPINQVFYTNIQFIDEP
jgi:hypothetical protein